MPGFRHSGGHAPGVKMTRASAKDLYGGGSKMHRCERCAHPPNATPMSRWCPPERGKNTSALENASAWCARRVALSKQRRGCRRLLAAAMPPLMRAAGAAGSQA
jgi:hypothetical protein